ncbi:DNA polymerase III subunit delta [Kiloniella sp. b19]|uniref:DNA polymerase III subunit delta n=1 Tax=Kiloniella sp. GXU_MW_B19 TaxID=3141326 RepID=UPI0031E27D5D
MRAVLVYGPDEGLVQERVQALMASVVDDLKDPFLVADLEADAIKKDPALLSDEVQAVSMMGGRRVIRIRSAGDMINDVMQDFLKTGTSSDQDAFVVLEGGDLPGRSKLRKLLENEKQAAAVPCYRDDERSLPNVISQIIESEGFFLDRDALAYLVGSLGGDRQQTRRELLKLCLYKGSPGGSEKPTITLEDATACIGDSSLLTLDNLSRAVAEGNFKSLETNLNKAWQDGQNPIPVLRTVARYFQRLHFVSGLVSNGKPMDQAVGSLRPPLFWKEANHFKQQAQVWTPRLLDFALSHLLKAEEECKKTGSPADVICARTLMEITSRSPLRRGAKR